jgi:prepilin-type N-terminal cleavage/methylation domain-containing protein
MIAPVAERRPMPAAGFTLLEVLLALALGALLMLAIGLAIDIHLRLVRTGRTEVERAQLARALLSRIAHDLRSTVQYSKASQSTDSTTTQQDTSTTATSENLADASTLPTVFGLYGNLKELQLDVVESPRADQIQSAVAAESATTGASPLSAVKTITYYMAANTVNASGASGLMRRELDRWQAAWLAAQGELADAGSEVLPLAPEVIDIEFHYYDGTEWVEEWDMSERSGLPMAVEVVLAIARPQAVAGLFASDASNAATQPRIYRITVCLPMGEPTTLTTTDSTSSSSTTTTGSGTGP